MFLAAGFAHATCCGCAVSLPVNFNRGACYHILADPAVFASAHRQPPPHSQAELNKGHRQNELQEVERSSDGVTGYGAQNQGSPMRHRLRSSGAMEGQVRLG